LKELSEKETIKGRKGINKLIKEKQKAKNLATELA
jgi:hypothetical protein